MDAAAYRPAAAGRRSAASVASPSSLSNRPAAVRCVAALAASPRSSASAASARWERATSKREPVLWNVSSASETLPRLLPTPAGAGDVAERALGQANGPGEPGLEADLDPLHRLLPRAEGVAGNQVGLGDPALEPTDQPRVAHRRQQLDRLPEERDRAVGIAVLEVGVSGPPEREGAVQRIGGELDATVAPVDRLLPVAAGRREPGAVPGRVALQAPVAE